MLQGAPTRTGIRIWPGSVIAGQLSNQQEARVEIATSEAICEPKVVEDLPISAYGVGSRARSGVIHRV